jgi:hypothetical protein
MEQYNCQRQFRDISTESTKQQHYKITDTKMELSNGSVLELKKSGQKEQRIKISAAITENKDICRNYLKK